MIITGRKITDVRSRYRTVFIACAHRKGSPQFTLVNLTVFIHIIPSVDLNGCVLFTNCGSGTGKLVLRPVIIINGRKLEHIHFRGG
ncbi:hypothetical protein D3C74_369050 [compost metagenome]